jgi:DNA mismatch endonuclease, patch repair protein
MQAQRTRDTGPEVAIRSAVHRAGLRYRVDARPLPNFPRKADLVFRRAKVAVFVDGCFWHSCPLHGRQSVANASWWRDKLARTQQRDADTTRHLVEAGWQVVRIWEHGSPEVASARIMAVVDGAVLS